MRASCALQARALAPSRYGHPYRSSRSFFGAHCLRKEAIGGYRGLTEPRGRCDLLLRLYIGGRQPVRRTWLAVGLVPRGHRNGVAAISARVTGMSQADDGMRPSPIRMAKMKKTMKSNSQ